MKFKNSALDVINTLCNYVVLNIVFLITCIPVITIGASLTALYSVTMREARGEYGYLVRTYIKEFKNNIKQGTQAFLIIAGLALVFSFNFFFWKALESPLGSIIMTLMLIFMFVLLCVIAYTFPLLARFENTTLQTLKNAIGLCFANVKATGALILIEAFVFFLAYFSSPFRILLVLFGFAFIAYVQSYVLVKVFEPYEKPQTCIQE
ncbi:MAG: DUF624 domain-containing protein [Lachnospiraceae bacterium]|nr:DUF624 domain-containing protein [Lachnospiraceae bacterium]